MSTEKPVECFKHYCPKCGAEHHIKRSKGPECEYPKCCGRHMRYLGVVTAIPGRDETNKK